MEIITGVERRRRWRLDEKLRIVAEAEAPGSCCVEVGYSADRKAERPREHLSGFAGVMHADAFPGYDALYRPEPGKPARIQHAACWAHARRKLFEVHESTKSPIPEAAVGCRRPRADQSIRALAPWIEGQGQRTTIYCFIVGFGKRRSALAATRRSLACLTRAHIMHALGHAAEASCLANGMRRFKGAGSFGAGRT